MNAPRACQIDGTDRRRALPSPSVIRTGPARRKPFAPPAAGAVVLVGILLAAGLGGYRVAIGQTKAPVPASANQPAAPRTQPSGPPAERADNYEPALARAKETGKDIVVFQRGSDWNRLGETLYHEVWMKDEFARELGPDVILVAVDHAEIVGGTAVPGTCSAKYCGPAGFTGVPVGSAPPLRLAKFTDDTSPLPANGVTAIKSQDGSTYRQRPDGAWLAEEKCPPHDTLTLQMKGEAGGRLLRLDFPTDPSLPGNGPGRASNGNFAISEIEVLSGGKPVKVEAAWASASHGHWGPWMAIDGIADKGDNLWNPSAHLHVRRTILLAINSDVPANTEIEVRLICRTQWGAHLPGCVSAAIIRNAEIEEDVRRVSRAQMELAKNRKFTWWDTSRCPRIALMDSTGRAVAAENKPRLGLTPQTMAARVKELRAVREKRDALWAAADKAQGPQKAELLRQSLVLLGFGTWPGNENCYKFVHDQIRAADPNDESGAVRWLGGVPWTEPNWSKALAGKDLTDRDYEEALARIDRDLRDPRNRILDNDRIQRMMLAKYHVYKRWPNHQEKRFDVQREIAALDPTTFLGIGATGYLGMHKKSEVPMLTYGWAPGQVKSGLNVWKMKDTAYFFDHAGPYTLRLAAAGGKDTLKIKRVALMDGAAVVSEATPDADLGPANKSVEVSLELPTWRADRNLVLRVEAEAAEGKSDSAGAFAVEPQLPANVAAVATEKAVLASGATESATDRLLAAGEIETLQRVLSDVLAAEANRDASGPTRIVSATPLRAALAQHELIRACGPTTMAGVAARPGGVALLRSLFSDADWMEAFLGSDPAAWGQALENLRLLSVEGEGFDQPFARRVGTALALQWGAGSRYRLVDRFRDVLQANRDGLLHISFENLSVREMRWAIPTFGTSKDYHFLLNDRQTTLGEYLGACHVIPYVDPNVYGDSVQGWMFVSPWTHHYGTGTGNRPFEAHRVVGGVCGTLSGYGSAVAQVHGVMSVTVGQPGHCAYVVRVGESWPVGNSVTWPTYLSAPGWDGTGYSTLHRLYEPVTQDHARYLTALRMEWLAHVVVDRSRRASLRVQPGLRYSLYREGVGAGLADFSKLTPTISDRCSRIDLAAVQPTPAERFGVVWEGKAEVYGKGPIKIALQSGARARVLIDGQPVLTAAGNRQEKEIELTPGGHAIRVEYSQLGEAPALQISFAGPLSATDGAWIAAYERAIAAQPTNFPVWLDYIKTLESAKDVTPKMWLDLARRAARTFAVSNEAGWALCQRCFDKASPTLTSAERAAFLLACHQDLRQENWVKPEGYEIGGNFNWQADRIGDPALAVDFFGKLLAIHHDAKPENNWIFGAVMQWGNNRFAAAPATAAPYARAMGDFFQSGGSTLDQGMIANTISTGIRKASQAGDMPSYRLWNDLAAKLLPPVKPQDVFLNPAQLAAAPKLPVFPGDLLSKDGMLRTSSACQFDRPFSYRQVLDCESPGWFDTNPEEKPWAEVQLAGEGELSGIVLVNRYEFPATHEEFQWAAPLKVSISTDAKTWTEVASFDKADATFVVDLQGRNLNARYVRIERQPTADKSKPPGRFHFRNFLVYGKKLY